MSKIFFILLIVLLIPSVNALTIILDPQDDVVNIVNNAPEYTTFIFEPGIYRLAESPSLIKGNSLTEIIAFKPKNGQIFIGKPGTILSGSRVVDGWVQEGSLWYSDGHTEPLLKQDIDKCFMYPNCNYLQDLRIDGNLLDRVLDKSQLKPGTWFFDDTADRIYTASDPRGSLVEFSTLPYAIKGRTVKDVIIRGLVIEQFATHTSDGAIKIETDWSIIPNWIIEQNEIRHNHAVGATSSGALVFRNNYVHNNGGKGLGMWLGRNPLIEGNEFAFNNKDFWFRYGWEASGMKLGKTENAWIRENYAHNNGGPGLWTDVESKNNLFENNIAFHNYQEGLVDEIGFGAIFKGNIAKYNGKVGINYRNSEDGRAFDNLVVVGSQWDGREPVGLQVRFGGRQREDNLYYSLNNSFYNNEVIYTTDSGWSGTLTSCKTDFHCSEDIKQETWINNYFNNNTYYYPNIEELRFKIGPRTENGWWRTFDGFRAEGKELNGQVSTTTPPQNGFALPKVAASVIKGNNIILKADVIADKGDVIGKVEFYIDDIKIGQTSKQPYQVTWFLPENGTHTLKAVAYSAHAPRGEYGQTGTGQTTFTLEDQSSDISPFRNHMLPGLIQSEDYDKGGQGNAYNDIDNINQDGAYRDDGVDIKMIDGGGHAVGWFKSGEWLKYTISNDRIENYTVQVRTGSAEPGREFTLLLDGKPLDTIAVPMVNSWGEFKIISSSIRMPEGTHVITINNTGQDYLDLDWMRFIPGSYSPPISSFAIENDIASIRDSIIYRTAYVNDGERWTAYSLETDSKVIGNWIINNASLTLRDNADHILIYSCTWQDRWDCHGNKWQMQFTE